ncbi:MAG: LamG domain-containing protein, partial [Verrucomicrobiae bacterium]|nr:LamG domain-containing protein [Verrucomicrobiae bacterium]
MKRILSRWFGSHPDQTPVVVSSGTADIETLEPRVLFSAAPVEVPDSGDQTAQTPEPDTSGDTQQGQVADSTGLNETPALDQGSVEIVAEAAKQRWIDAGISDAQLDALNSITYQITDLGGEQVSSANGTTITIDKDAAGRGWFIDGTPGADEEFVADTDSSLDAVDGSEASEGIDLLTALLHEQGHVLGLDDGITGSVLMDGEIGKGERRLPASGEAIDAGPGSLQGDHYLTAVGNILFTLDKSTLAEGESATVNGSFDNGGSLTNTVSVYWGDGTIDHQTLTGGVSTFSATHQYLENGAFEVNVIVTEGTLGQALAGHWNFDDGTATDLTTYGNNGSGGTIAGGDTPFGSGQVLADGSVSIPSTGPLDTLNDEITISFWAKVDSSTPAWSRVLTKYTSSPAVGWHISKYNATTDINIRADTVGDDSRNNQNLLFAGDDVFDNTWHHVVFTLNNGVAREYLDGTFIQEQNYQHGDGLANIGNLVVGSAGLVGSVDDLALWGRVLSDTEIGQLAAAPLEVNSTSGTAERILVTDVAPVINSLRTTPGAAAGEVSLTVDFSDPGTLDEHKAVIDWGDGGEPEEVLLVTGARTLQISHAYTPSSDATINVTVVDRMGDAVGIWNFDAGNGVDSSGNGNDGTGGAFSSDTASVFGGGQSLDGAGTPITVPNSPSLEGMDDEMSLSFWIKGDASSEGNWVRIIRKGTEVTGTTSWMVTRYSNTDDLLIRTDTIGTGGAHNRNQHDGQGGPILDNEWHHVVYVLNNGVSQEYVDGILTNQESYPVGEGLSNTEPVSIGHAINSALLDEVILYDRALTPQQVAALTGAMDVSNARDTKSLEVTTGGVAISDSTPGGDNNDYQLTYDPIGSGSGPEYVITDPVSGLDMRVPVANVTEPIVINGSEGDDTLTIDLSNGAIYPAINFDGGAGGNDDIIITGGGLGTATYGFVNENDGSIQLEGQGLITYTGLEPVTSTITAADVVLNYAGGAETITITDNGTTITVDSTLGESVTFNNPTNSLVINAGTDDTVVFANAFSMAADLTITGANTELSGQVDIGANDLIFNGNAQQTTTGVTLTASTIAFNGDTTLLNTGGGAFQIRAASGATNASGSLFNVNGGRLQLLGGTTFTNNGDIVTGAGTASPVFADSQTNANNRIINNGVFTHNSSQIRLYVEITNTASGQLIFDTTAGNGEVQMKAPQTIGTGGVIRNQGSVTVTGGNTFRFDESGQVINENGATFTLASGNLAFAEDATFTNQSGGIVNLSGGSVTVDATTFVSEAGGTLNLNNGSLNLINGGSATSAGTANLFDVDYTIGGTGTFTNDGIFNFTPNGTARDLTLNTLFQNNGTTNYSVGDHFDLFGTGSFSNAGIFNHSINGNDNLRLNSFTFNNQ